MKRRLSVGTILTLLLASVAFVFANELKTVVVPTAPGVTIHVPNDHVLKIHNFTQDGGSMRGVVTVTISGVPANVLTAALVNPSATPEPINQVVIAGPADVTATCDATSTGGCVLSYVKEKTSSD